MRARASRHGRAAPRCGWRRRWGPRSASAGERAGREPGTDCSPMRPSDPVATRAAAPGALLPGGPRAHLPALSPARDSRAPWSSRAATHAASPSIAPRISPACAAPASLAAETLDMITPHVRPGVTTGELDRLCHELILDHGAIPAPLGYRGYPKSICTSINHVVCHGIPGERVLARRRHRQHRRHRHPRRLARRHQPHVRAPARPRPRRGS